jgi:hypothetical protein
MWNSLTPEQAVCWEETSGDSPKNQTSAKKQFISLASKAIQANPQAVIQLHPPETAFGGDAISITVRACPAVLPSGAAHLSGGIFFEASGVNAPGVVTELLAQRLPDAETVEPDRFLCVGVALFLEGDAGRFVPISPGHYACACRFIRLATGQTSALQFLGRVQVDPVATDRVQPAA